MAEESTRKPNRRAERIGKYEILEHIASGGMGIVYMARDPDLDRRVALKILSPDLAKQHTTLIRFQREARAAALLRHDNIVSIYEIGESFGAHYIALEYVDGTDLQAYISRKVRMDPNEARLLMVQATRALVHAHEHGIVHRDIKPSNFLLMFKDKHTILKLTDFGLAIRNENDEEFRITKDKTTVGTVDYMSPEQARDSRSADIRSDIYSLGCTFYHMLGGTAPFARGTLPERIVQHMRTPAPDVRKLNQSVPESLVTIIQKMLAKKPDDRYQTPADLLYDLEHPELVELPRKNGDGASKRGRIVSRKSRADVTSVIESKAIDEASAQPIQIKRPRNKKPASDEPIDRRPRMDDDEPTEEPISDEGDEQADSVDEEVETKPTRARTKNTIATSSPIWMYATAGTVAVLGLILVLAFAFGSRPTLTKKDPEKKNDGGPPITTNLDKKEEKIEKVVRPIPEPPDVPVTIDTSPEKMTVEAPTLPTMDVDPAKVDRNTLRKEYYGPFEAFPTAPAKANVVQVRRFSVVGKTSFNTLADAMAQTKPEQVNVIEIPDNGPIFVSALPALAKRTIVLRGADGYRPLVVWDLPKKPADAKAATTFLELTEGRLILENLDFVVSVPAETRATIFDLSESDLFACDCTFSIAGVSGEGIPLIRRANPKPIGVEARKTQTWLQRCYVRGQNAILVQHRDTPAEVLVEESLIVGYQHPLLAIRCKDEDLLALYCVRSTLVAGNAVVRWQASVGNRVNPHFQGRVLDSILSRDDLTSPQGDMLQILDANETNRMNWRASNSVYAGWKQLLASGTKNVAGHDLDGWHRHWSYSLGDRVVGEAWPASPPTGLDEQSATMFLPTHTPLAYSALTFSGTVGCVIGRLPPVPDNWRERTLEPRPTLTFANIEADPPRIEQSTDGMYHGERLDLNKVDLGLYLSAVLQKTPPAPRVVIHLTGKGVCATSPLRIKGVRHLVLYADPTRDPFVLEVNPKSFAQRGPLIEMTGGHLEIIGARIRLSSVTFLPTLIQVQNGNLTLSRCWLAGPLAKTAESFKSLITVANTDPASALILMRENVLVSSKQLLHAKDNVHIKARNNAFVSLGDGVLFEAATPPDTTTHVFDHNTWAVRQAFFQLRASNELLPKGPMQILVTGDAFLRPFEGDADRATLTKGFESWSASGRWVWQGRYNVYDVRVPAFHLPANGKTSPSNAKWTLKDWQRTWGQAGEFEAQALEPNLSTRELTLEGMTPVGAFTQMDRLLLPRQLRVDVTQGFPGADLYTLGILKKKG